MSPKKILDELLLLAKLVTPREGTTPSAAGASTGAAEKAAAEAGGPDTAAAAGEGGSSSSSSSSGFDTDLSGMSQLHPAALERAELLLNVAQYNFTSFDQVRAAGALAGWWSATADTQCVASVKT